MMAKRETVKKWRKEAAKKMKMQRKVKKDAKKEEFQQDGNRRKNLRKPRKKSMGGHTARTETGAGTVSNPEPGIRLIAIAGRRNRLKN